MTTKAARIYFTVDGPVADFQTNDGARDRSSVRRPAELDAAEFHPVTVTSYRQLLDLVAEAGVTFAGEDVAAEESLAAAEAARAANQPNPPS